MGVHGMAARRKLAASPPPPRRHQGRNPLPNPLAGLPAPRQVCLIGVLGVRGVFRRQSKLLWYHALIIAHRENPVYAIAME